MATNGYTTIGISNVADTLLNQLHDLESGQKRELISALLVGLLVSEPGVIVAILNAGRMFVPVFNTGVEPILGAGVTFPPGHVMEGYSATNDVEKITKSVISYREALAEEIKKTGEAKEEKPKGKG